MSHRSRRMNVPLLFYVVSGDEKEKLFVVIKKKKKQFQDWSPSAG